MVTVVQRQPGQCLSSHLRSGSIAVGSQPRKARVGIVSVSPTTQLLGEKVCYEARQKARRVSSCQTRDFAMSLHAMSAESSLRRREGALKNRTPCIRVPI